MTGKHAKPDDEPRLVLTIDNNGNNQITTTLDPQGVVFWLRKALEQVENRTRVTPEQVDLITGGEPAQPCTHPKYETDSDNETGLFYCGDCGEPWAGNPPKPVFQTGGEPAAAEERCDKSNLQWPDLICSGKEGHTGQHVMVMNPHGDKAVWQDRNPKPGAAS